MEVANEELAKSRHAAIEMSCNRDEHVALTIKDFQTAMESEREAIQQEYAELRELLYEEIEQEHLSLQTRRDCLFEHEQRYNISRTYSNIESIENAYERKCFSCGVTV